MLPEKTLKSLGEGSIVKTEKGVTLFKLSSHPQNPIISPKDLSLTWSEEGEEREGAVFNPGAEYFGEGIMLLPRCQKGYKKLNHFPFFKDYVSEIWPLYSKDALHFERMDEVVIKGDGSEHKDFEYGIEDVRVIRHGKGYILVGCGKRKPPFVEDDTNRVAVYYTEDFKEIHYKGVIDCFDTRNAVPFFHEGDLFLLLRFYPHIQLVHLKEGVEQLLNPSKYKRFWEKVYEEREQHLLLAAGQTRYEAQKIGAGPPPIKTEKGLLLIYHAVGEVDADVCRVYGLNDKIKEAYTVCAALLDLEEPHRLLCRTTHPIYIPSKPYELYGDATFSVDVPAVVFPTGALKVGNTLLIYCGAADKYVIILSCSIEYLLDYLFKYCKFLGGEEDGRVG